MRSTAAATIMPPMSSTTRSLLPGRTLAMASMLASVSGRSSRVLDGCFSKWNWAIWWMVGSSGVKTCIHLLRGEGRQRGRWGA